VDLTIDGVPIPTAGRGSIRAPIRAGIHTIGAASTRAFDPGNMDSGFSAPGGRGGGVTGITITGPYGLLTPGDTPSRRKIFVCYPANMTGHKLVRFNQAERENLVRFVDAGGLLFSDDCNHDVDGLYAQSFEDEMRRVFPGEATLAKLPNSHALYRTFFEFPEGPPQTSHELNGWGDDMIHDYLRGVDRRGRLGVLYSNKDYGCEWDYDWRNKRFRREDNTRFAVNIVVYAMTGVGAVPGA
jgi:hypothetical protein